MTRYEMAQIVAKAMAKGANVDKLAAEFADELDALGVRVAALEKKADNVKITGNIRWRWRNGSVKNAAGNRRKQMGHDLRSRLFFNGQINDTWKYTGMVENIQDFRTDVGEDANFDFQRAFITGRVGGVKVELGRNHVSLVGGDSDVYANRVDHIKGTFGDKFKISGWYGKPTGMNEDSNHVQHNNYSVFAGARLSYDWNKFGVYAEYDKFSGKHRARFVDNSVVPPALRRNDAKEIFGIGANAKFGDFGVKALYLHGKTSNVNNGKKNGWTLEATYKGANPAKVGSWGLGLKYYDQGNHTFISIPGSGNKHGIVAVNGAYMPVGAEGFKGFRLSANYTVAKNMVGTINYIDLKGKGNNAGKAKTLYTQMVFTF
jgi:hypothetical protein